ncbi:LysR family transcriptional regulator [Pseudomonas frederiksbergensis]|uniref:LysR family transcriptional regulator n=1 Tax=Pseudomonas frederiksbergensis TaxID=104087 RepID=UPI003D04CB2C
MDSISIGIFVQVADTRSFVVAGRALGISASGVGKSISRLEQRLGVRLFHRSTRSVTLTVEGEIFLEHGRKILAGFQAAEADLSNSLAIAQGRLRVSLPLISEPFVSILADFQLRFPLIELDLDFDNRIVDVIEEGYDAVIRSGELVDSRLNARYLGRFHSVLVGAPEYFSLHGTPTCPGDLASHACIHFRLPHTGKLQSWDIHAESGDGVPDLPVKLICNTNEARVGFALKGVGIAYMSDFTVRDAIADGTLVTVLDRYTNKPDTLHLLWPSGRNITPKLRAFIDFMSEHSPLDKQ